MAYDIIATNRSAKGYPLSLTKERLLATTAGVEHGQLFSEAGWTICSLRHRLSGNADIPLVVYWGDIPGYE